MAEVVERVANLEGRFDAQAGELIRVRDAVATLDGKVERRFEAVDRRFEAVDRRFDALDRKVDLGFAELRAELRSHFRWIMGGIGGAVATVIMSLFAKDWWW